MHALDFFGDPIVINELKHTLRSQRRAELGAGHPDGLTLLLWSWPANLHSGRFFVLSRWCLERKKAILAFAMAKEQPSGPLDSICPAGGQGFSRSGFPKLWPAKRCRDMIVVWPWFLCLVSVGMLALALVVAPSLSSVSLLHLVSLVEYVLAQLPDVPQLSVLEGQQLPQPCSVESLLLQLARDLGVSGLMVLTVHGSMVHGSGT